MAETVLYEVLRRKWFGIESSKTRQRGFFQEIKPNGLYAYHGYDDPREEDDTYKLDVCHLTNARLQGLLQYIRDEQLAQTDDAAMEVLLYHLRFSAQNRPRGSLPIVLGLFPLLCCLVTMAAAAILRDAVEAIGVPVLILQAGLIAAPLCWLIMIMLKNREKEIGRACEIAYANKADEYCRQLHALTTEIDRIEKAPFWAAPPSLLIGLLVWLLIAVALLFIH